MLINRGMTERRETSDLQPRTEEKPIKLTPGTAGKNLTKFIAWADIALER